MEKVNKVKAIVVPARTPVFCALCVCLSADESCTDKKDNKIFLIYREIQSGAVAKSYMRKGFLIFEEMRKYFPIYEEAVYMTLQLLHSGFPYI
jgi:hypothetical protein